MYKLFPFFYQLNPATGFSPIVVSMFGTDLVIFQECAEHWQYIIFQYLEDPTVVEKYLDLEVVREYIISSYTSGLSSVLDNSQRLDFFENLFELIGPDFVVELNQETGLISVSTEEVLPSIPTGNTSSYDFWTIIKYSTLIILLLVLLYNFISLN